MRKDIRGSIKEPLGEFVEKSDRWYEAWWAGEYNSPAVVAYRHRWRRAWGIRVFYGNIRPVYEIKPSFKNRSEAEDAIRSFVDGMNPTDYIIGFTLRPDEEGEK